MSGNRFLITNPVVGVLSVLSRAQTRQGQPCQRLWLMETFICITVENTQCKCHVRKEILEDAIVESVPWS